MTVIARAIYETTQLGSAAASIYVAPANTRTLLDKMTITNPTAGALTFTVNLVPEGGTAGADNIVVSAQSVAAGATYLCPEIVGHVLNTGDFVSAFASAATSLVVRISGREVS